MKRPWKMYPLGILFGLGFDTSSEIALLGISSIQATAGTSLWLILLFPVLFTAGMCLLDTVDGALMMSLYTSTTKARDPLAVLYYNIVLTCLTVMVAVVIGVLQMLGLVVAVAPEGKLQGPFWEGVNNALDRYDVIGGAVCAAFVVCGVGSVVLYPRWKQWIDRGERPEEPDDGGSHVQLEHGHEQQQITGAKGNMTTTTMTTVMTDETAVEAGQGPSRH